MVASWRAKVELLGALSGCPAWRDGVPLVVLGAGWLLDLLCVRAEPSVVALVVKELVEVLVLGAGAAAGTGLSSGRPPPGPAFWVGSRLVGHWSGRVAAWEAPSSPRNAWGKASCAVAGMYPLGCTQLPVVQFKWTSALAGWVNPRWRTCCSSALSCRGKVRPLPAVSSWRVVRMRWMVCQGMGGPQAGSMLAQRSGGPLFRSSGVKAACSCQEQSYIKPPVGGSHSV